MNGILPLTIIDNKEIRGILAPSRVVSKKLLEDIIDFIELSSIRSARETAFLLRDGDIKKTWIGLDKVAKMANIGK